MLLDEKVARGALKYISGETTHVCRLCFSITDKKEIRIDEDINVESSYYETTVSLINMLRELGISLESQLPQVLCDNCSANTVNAYLLKKLFQISNDNWNNIMHRLSLCLIQSDTMNSNTNSVYFMINKKDNLLLTSRKSNLSKNKRTALLKLKEIEKSRLKYFKEKHATVATVCEECGEKCITNAELIKHLKIHGKSQYPCRFCTKNFSSAAQVKDHAERVHYPKELQCPQCPKKFSTKRILKIHERTLHVTAICKLCLGKFPSRKQLRAHLDTHKVNICPKCKKKFRSNNTFRVHVKKCGNNVKNLDRFICDICNKGYSRKNSIRTHLKIDHGFGDVLSCNWCDKKFDAKSRLRNHIVKHTKEKKFHCDQCDKNFVSNAALVYHTRLHTGERPFPCEMCNESFLSASRRTEHKRRKHFGPSHECQVCHLKFLTSHQLHKHGQRHNDPYSKLYVKAGMKIGNLFSV